MNTKEYALKRDGKTGREVNNRMRKAASVYYQISSSIVGKREVSRATKMQIYRLVYLPILTCGNMVQRAGQKVVDMLVE